MTRDPAIERERRAREQRERARRRAQRAQATARMAPPPEHSVAGGSATATRAHREGLVGWLVRTVRDHAGSIGDSVRDVGRGAASRASVVGRAAATTQRPGAFKLPRRPTRHAQPASHDTDERLLTPPARVRARSRQRARALRRLRVLIAVIVLVVGLVGWRIVPSWDAFRIRHLELVGASSVGDLDVRSRIDALLRGQTIYTIDTDAISHEIAALPFVRSVSIDRHFPGGITIRIVEHRPLALGYDSSARRWWLIAPDGRVLARASEREWSGRIPLVRLTSDRLRPGMHVAHEPAIELLQELPSDSTLAIRSIDVSSHAITATVQDGIKVRLGRARQLRTKLAAAERMLQIAHSKNTRLAYVDVAVPGRPVPCPYGQPCASIPPPDSASSRLQPRRRTTSSTAADDVALADDGALAGVGRSPAQGPNPVAAAATTPTGQRTQPRRLDQFDLATGVVALDDASGAAASNPSTEGEPTRG